MKNRNNDVSFSNEKKGKEMMVNQFGRDEDLGDIYEKPTGARADKEGKGSQSKQRFRPFDLDLGIDLDGVFGLQRALCYPETSICKAYFVFIIRGYTSVLCEG